MFSVENHLHSDSQIPFQFHAQVTRIGNIVPHVLQVINVLSPHIPWPTYINAEGMLPPAPLEHSISIAPKIIPSKMSYQAPTQTDLVKNTSYGNIQLLKPSHGSINLPLTLYGLRYVYIQKKKMLLKFPSAFFNNLGVGIPSRVDDDSRRSMSKSSCQRIRKDSLTRANSHQQHKQTKVFRRLCGKQISGMFVAGKGNAAV